MPAARKGELDEAHFNAWMTELLTSRGEDLLRMKGVLAAPDVAAARTLYCFWLPRHTLFAVRRAYHVRGASDLLFTLNLFVLVPRVTVSGTAI